MAGAPKKTVVSRAGMQPVVPDAPAARAAASRAKRAADELCVELGDLVRERPLSRAYQARTRAGSRVALVVVADGATARERELFARTAQDLHAAGGAAAGVLRVHAVTRSGDAFLADLWTSGSARDLAALKWPPRRRVELVRAVAATLDGVHTLGLVHGCLCPANILLDDDLSPVVAEVGAVPVHALAERGGEAEMYEAYAAPEILRGEAPTARSDVYSLGRLLDELTRGEPVPDALRAIVARCLAAGAADRFPAAADLGAALDGVLDQLSSQVADPPRQPALPAAPTRAGAAADRATEPRRRGEPRTTRDFDRHPTAWTWQPPRWLGGIGLAAIAGALAGGALLGGGNDALRLLSTIALVAGSALATALVPPAPRAPAAVRALLALALGALLLAFDPLAPFYRFAAQRQLRADPASRHLAIAELLRLGRDFRGLSLAGLDLSSEDLTGADLRGVDLSRANLSRARLFAAEVQGASFAGVDLAGADLEQVELELARGGVADATCDEATRLPREWRCTGGHVARVPR
jgi:hypothetical protein